jgi:murein DD-endopeptidase MepM/ murein hydrolase activator NlpD
VSVDRLSNSQVSPSGTLPVGNDRQNLENLQAKELAQEFESMLILQMLRQMRQSMLDGSEEESGLSASTMLDQVDMELSRQLSKQGGFGLGDIMTKAIQQQLPGAHSAETITMGSAVTWPTSTASSDDMTDAAALGAGVSPERLTSNYGWRADPFSGAAKYHRGIDLKAAYGTEVPAASDGKVVEVGENGAYGLTVVVDHGSGLKTRYAHLATTDVTVGDQVLQGQDIGRVGQSGRATGPHLHFEVIRNGQRVDPTMEVALQGPGLGGLKLAQADADSNIGERTRAAATSGADDED